MLMKSRVNLLFKGPFFFRERCFQTLLNPVIAIRQLSHGSLRNSRSCRIDAKSNTLTKEIFPKINNEFKIKNRFYSSKLANDQFTLQEQCDEKGIPFILYVKDSAKKQLEKIAERKPEENSVLRVTVDGGGCHGYQVSFRMDNKIGNADT